MEYFKSTIEFGGKVRSTIYYRIDEDDKVTAFRPNGSGSAWSPAASPAEGVRSFADNPAKFLGGSLRNVPISFEDLPAEAR